ncbi:MAG TPA: N-acetylmuramoyl-L-alanine amidase [Chthoniobacterales bacterium]
MIRFRVFLGTALALSAIVATFVNAQLTDEEKKKRDARIKAREEMRAVASPAPAETPEPTAKPKPAKRKTKSKKQPTPKPKSTVTRAAKKSPTPEPDESPTSKNKAKSGTKKSSEQDETPKPETEKTESGESPEPTKKPGARKSPTPESDESPAPKAKAKSGTKKSSEEDEEATPRPKRTEKAKSKESPEPKKKPRARKSPTPEPEESPIPKSGVKKKTDAKKEATPKRIEKADPAKTPAPIEKPLKTAPEPARTPAPEPSAHPRPTPPTPHAALPPDITVEKSGLEKEQGLEPPPPPPPRRGFWPWSRLPANYRYLTSANIDAIRRAPVQRARWKYVIVHNSGTRQGNARAFDYYHRKIRRMRNGLAYHFVIGNGTSSRNGQIEIGDRWRRQINGGHVHSDYMNNIGLGICLVGDFNRDQPTRAQLEACEELIRYLQERCGKSDGRSLIVRPHREVNPPRWATDCPGDAFPYGWFGRFR